MKAFCTFFLLLFSSGASLAQYALEGKVIDAYSEQPVIGASVYLPDLKKGAITNQQGIFRIDNVSRGKFLLQIKSIGYASLVRQIDVRGSMQITLSLSSSITELNEVVISGVSHSTELKKNPIPVVTVPAEALLKNHAFNIIDNITRKPGVDQISTGSAISKPVVRGLSFNRVITLYDGVRQEGQQWGEEHGVEIDEFSVERVEIIKGAGSLMYGSDGIGGVINFLPADPVHEGVVEGQWQSNYQSNNGLISNSLSNSGNIKGLYWAARISQKLARAYQNKYDGRVLNSGFRENDFSLVAGLNKSWGYTQFSAMSFNQNVGMVEGERDSNGKFLLPTNVNGAEEMVTATDEQLKSYTLYTPNQGIRHLRFANSTNIFWNNVRSQLNVGYQNNKRKEFGNVLDENEEELFFDLHTVNYSAIVYLPETNAWNFSIGTSGMWQRSVNRGEEFLIPEYDLRDWGAVVFAKKNFSKLDVAAGLRFDHRGLSISSLHLDEEGRPTRNSSAFQKFAAADLAFFNYSATAGATYQFTDIFSLKINASRGFRAPNISELASNGSHEGSLRYEYGNYALKPETSFQADVALLFNAPHLSLEASVFSNIINNYIYVEKLLSKDGSDSIPDIEDPVPAYRYTQGKALVTGGELLLDIHPHPLDWLHFENGLSVVYSQNKSADNDTAKHLPFTPAPRLQSELRADVKRWKKFSALFFKIQHQWYGAQNRVFLENGTETETASYSLWNTGLGLDLNKRSQGKLLSFYFSVNNIFSTAYQHHLSRLKYAPENPITGRAGVFNIGRNFSFRIIVPITFKK